MSNNNNNTPVEKFVLAGTITRDQLPPLPPSVWTEEQILDAEDRAERAAAAEARRRPRGWLVIDNSWRSDW